MALATTDLTSYNNKVADAITIRTGPGSTLTVNTIPAPRTLVLDRQSPDAGRADDRARGGLADTGAPEGLAAVAPVLLLAGAIRARRRHPT